MLSERLTEWWQRERLRLFAVGCVALIGAALLATRLPQDRSITRMLPPGDPERQAWEEFRRIFGPQEVVIVAYRDENLFAWDGSGIRRLSKIRQQLRELPGVNDAWGLDQFLGGWIALPTTFTQDLRRLLENYTHNAAGDMAAILVSLRSHPRGGPPTEALRAIESLVQSLPEGVAVGPPVLADYGYRLVQADGRRIAWTAGVLLFIVILLCSGRLRWGVLAGLTIALAVAGAQATFFVLGRSASLINSVLFGIIAVISVATLMHVAVRFEGHRLRGNSDGDALRHTVSQLWRPVTLAIITDAVGFGALLTATVGPVRDFALLVVIALGWLLIAFIVFLPAVALFSPFDSFRKECHRTGDTPGTRLKKKAYLERTLRDLAKSVVRHPMVVGFFVGGCLLIGLSGWWQVDFETDFTRNFRSSSPIVQAYERLETELGGAGVWDIALPAPAVLSSNYLTAVRRLEERLRNEVKTARHAGQPGLAKVLSLADVAALTAIKIPFANAPAASNWGLWFLRTRIPGLYNALHRPDPHVPDRWWFRILLRSRERQTGPGRTAIVTQVRRIVEEEWPQIARHLEVSPPARAPKVFFELVPTGFAEHIRDTQPTEYPRPIVTGYYVLMGKMVTSVLADQRWSFLVAVCGMAAVLALGLRGLIGTVGALLVNLIPILLLLGVVGWIGLRLNLGSAMMAAVALGLSVDGSIHYLTVYRRSRARGTDPFRAILRAESTVGIPTLFATVALVVGFLGLTRSDFVPTVHFGILLSVTMLGGLLCNLCVLPWFLALTGRRRRQGRGKRGNRPMPEQLSRRQTSPTL